MFIVTESAALTACICTSSCGCLLDFLPCRPCAMHAYALDCNKNTLANSLGEYFTFSVYSVKNFYF